MGIIRKLRFVNKYRNIFIGITVFFLFYWFKFTGKSFVKQKGKNPLDDLKAESFADALYIAMHDDFTDWDSIKSVFEQIDKEGYKQIFNVFGQRRYVNILGGHGTDVPFIGQKLNLTQWLNYELWDSEKQTVNELLNYSIF